MSNVPDNLRYAETHEWLRMEENGTACVGITDHAQAELTDVVFVELPGVDAVAQAGHPIAVVESVKAASDIYSPVSGVITEVNPALSANPALVNTDPYGEGWLFRLKLSNPPEVEGLQSATAYMSKVG